MRRLIAAVVLLGLSVGADAQQLPPPPSDPGAVGVSLKLSVEQLQLIVQSLPSIGCQNVQQLIVCNKAIALIEELKRQAKEQVK